MQLLRNIAKKIVGDHWERCFRRLPEPKTKDPMIIDEDAVRRALDQSEIPVEEYKIDVLGFQQWLEKIDYLNKHEGYYLETLSNKALQHFAAAELLQLQPGQHYIDIAGQTHTVRTIYEEQFGVEGYLQDLELPEGFHGREIGGDAAKMNVPDNWADAMALHCSFEHFEGESDSNFIREVERVLKPGGKCVIAPLYLFQEHACFTDPSLAVPGGVAFDSDAKLFATREWRNRHGRFYSVQQLEKRVWKKRGDLKMKVLRVTNCKEIGDEIYLRYIGVLEKS